MPASHSQGKSARSQILFSLLRQCHATFLTDKKTDKKAFDGYEPTLIGAEQRIYHRRSQSMRHPLILTGMIAILAGPIQ